MLTLKELWELKVGKLLITWLFAMIFYSTYLWMIEDIFIKISLLFLGFSIASIPLWIAGYAILKRKRRIRINRKYIFKYGRIFEFLFFLFLFCATFFLTFFSIYLNDIQSSRDFFFFLTAGLGLMFFLINAIISGYFHYVFGFHD